MQSSRIIQSSKRLLFAAPFLAILVPLFFTLSIRSQPSLVSPSGDSPLIAYVHECMTSGFCWRRHLLRPFALFTEIPNRGAADFPESRLRRDHASSALVNIVLQKVLSRAVYGRLCTYVRAHFLSHYGRQHHQPGSRAILRSHALGLLSAGGARPRLVPRLSGRRGMLFCQPCAQPQGEIIQVTGIIIFILYRHCC